MTGLERRVRAIWWVTLATGAAIITVASFIGQWMSIPAVVWAVTMATALRALSSAVPDYVDTDEEYAAIVVAGSSRHRLGRPLR